MNLGLLSLLQNDSYVAARVPQVAVGPRRRARNTKIIAGTNGQIRVVHRPNRCPGSHLWVVLAPRKRCGAVAARRTILARTEPEGADHAGCPEVMSEAVVAVHRDGDPAAIPGPLRLEHIVARSLVRHVRGAGDEDVVEAPAERRVGLEPDARPAVDETIALCADVLARVHDDAVPSRLLEGADRVVVD